MRDIDRIIKAIREDDNIPPVQQQVLVERVVKEPTPEELERARAMVYPNPGSGSGGEVYLDKLTTRELLEELQMRGDLARTACSATPRGADGSMLRELAKAALRALSDTTLEADQDG